MLCRVASVSARRLHLDSTQSSDTINKSLNLIATGNTTTETAGDDTQVAMEPVAMAD
jgi:hypothetical protein